MDSLTNALWLIGGVALVTTWLVYTGYKLGKRKIHKQENTGEAAVRKALAQYCKVSTAHVLNNVTLPYEDGTTQIDHILVTQNGVLVVETKHYSGWLFANEKQKQWTQVIFKVKSKFQNPIMQNAKHVKAVRELLDFLPPEQVEGIVVFTGDAVFKTSIPQGVLHISKLTGYADIIRLGDISENRVQFCVGRLECKRLELSDKTDVEHNNYLRQKFGETR